MDGVLEGVLAFDTQGWKSWFGFVFNGLACSSWKVAKYQDLVLLCTYY